MVAMILLTAIIPLAGVIVHAVPANPDPSWGHRIEVTPPRDLIGPAPRQVSHVERISLGSILSQFNDILADVRDPDRILNVLGGITPGPTPTSMEDVHKTLESIYATTPTNLFAAFAQQMAAGLVGPGMITNIVSGLTTGENSPRNLRNRAAAQTIYPKKDAQDAAYTVPEEQLRAAVYFPPDFTYGKKPPVLMVPGTGSYGGNAFRNNVRKTMTGVDWADPVWVNVPDALLNDAQMNGEHAAYAINYVSSVCGGRNLSVVSWSQGALSTQWAFTYFPSTRKVVEDFMPISADFHGTVMANGLCLNIRGNGGVLPQQRTSNFIATLRGDGGDSAYVPTTSFWSGFVDPIVQPQNGEGASAYLLDKRKVGVSNIQVGTVCGSAPAGGFYEHAGVMYNPLVHALIKDAMTHPGPGDPKRINITAVCSTYLAPGLETSDALSTLGLLPIAGYLLLAADNKSTTEPVLWAYANKSVLRPGSNGRPVSLGQTGDAVSSGVVSSGVRVPVWSSFVPAVPLAQFMWSRI